MVTLTKKRSVEALRSRFITLAVILCLAFFVLWIRLWYLQIVNGDKYRSFSENNRIEVLSIPASRGIIYDRNRNILVDNRPSYNITMTRAYTKDYQAALKQLKKILVFLDLDTTLNTKGLESASRFRPFVLRQDVDRELLSIIETNKTSHIFDGIGILVKPTRNYLYKELLSHVLGYLGEIDEHKLKKLNETASSSKMRYRIGDTLGIYGLEKAYEDVLRGDDGAIPVEVDARGRMRSADETDRILPLHLKKAPTPGHNLVLTIDVALQKAASDAFSDDESGTVVVVDVKTGEILVLLSKPGFDPTIFSRPISQSVWQSLSHAPGTPLVDKTLRGLYSPGSTYKMLMGIAGLSEGLVDKLGHVSCNGYFGFAGNSHRCWAWKKGGHGLVGLREAIQHSCNVYFYQLGLLLGVDKIHDYALALHLGKKSGIGINHEKSGLIPSTVWKQKVKGERWYDGETISVAIGQGATLLTPLQMALMTATIANDGDWVKPRLVRTIESAAGEIIDDLRSMAKYEPATIDKAIFKTIKSAMYAVVNEKGGTAYHAARSSDIVISGKTGTSQVVALKNADPEDETSMDHSIFVAFAPYDTPEIAVSVVFEHGGSGTEAAKKAKKIIEAYHNLKQQNLAQKGFVK